MLPCGMAFWPSVGPILSRNLPAGHSRKQGHWHLKHRWLRWRLRVYRVCQGLCNCFKQWINAEATFG